ncbi:MULTISPECIES: mechanosensitive ion channel family protein [unclassified Candidatus Tisiphia]|uniref:mechanosensitive ion channel family protein n=1 Tax=unclassified Candidatus Tisiphia TaxID=2996318 RepID=UPI001E6C7885|nr:MAG: mechanosensitive ion channel family protein [Rickettsia endosymbiont of Cimex lectularius]
MTQYLLHLYHKYDKETFMLIIMIVSIIPLVIVIKTVIFSMIKNYINKRHHDYEKTFKKYSIYTYLLHTLLSLYLIFWGNILQAFPIPHWIISIKNIVITLYTGSFVTLLILSLIEAFADIYRNKMATSVQAYLSLYTQISKILIVSVATIIIISSILNISLGAFFTSLGAAAALLTFLFKDTVTGLLASLQLISQDIIRIGDFVTVNQYNVEGTVEKITITVVKIKNADQTISTIPTSSLLTTNVVNSRGITESVAKKIQRAICIDTNSIVFVPTIFIQELQKSPYLAPEAINKVNLEHIGSDITNIKIFRLYIKEYLKNHPAIYKENFTFLVRQLAPTPNGLPIELYVFTNETRGDIYEDIQSGIFDHLFAVIPEFKLKVFQNNNV